MSEIKDLNDKIDKLQATQDKILFYLYNDSNTDTKGVIQQVRDLRVDVDSIKQRENIRTAKISIISTILGAIGGFLVKILF